MLAQNRIERATGARAKHPSLLAGLLFDEAGGRLTPTYAVKKGTRYRYYVSTGLLIGAKKELSNGWRIPAANLEGLVIDRLRAFFADPGAVLDAIDDESGGGSGQRQLIERGRQAAEELEAQAPDKVKSILMTLACRVVINLDRIDVNISRRRLAAFLAGQSIDPTMIDRSRQRETSAVVTLVVPARLKRVGREMKMLVENSDDRTAVDHSLLRIIARAHDIQARLIQNTRLTVHDIAREERVSAAYVYNLLRLPWLAPDITTAIVNGEQPQRLNAKTLMRRASRLPAHWSEQRTQLGFR
jgi:site-specific DNA recombinase